MITKIGIIVRRGYSILMQSNEWFCSKACVCVWSVVGVGENMGAGLRGDG